MRLLLILLLIPTLAFAGITDARKNSILDTEFSGTHYIALFSSACTDSTAGTELSGNGYARQAFTFASAASGSKASNTEETFAASGGDWLEATHFGIYTASSGGTYKFCGALTPSFTLLDTESRVFASGNIVVRMD